MTNRKNNKIEIEINKEKETIICLRGGGLTPSSN
jgi:hypothetical protein